MIWGILAVMAAVLSAVFIGRRWGRSSAEKEAIRDANKALERGRRADEIGSLVGYRLRERLRGGDKSGDSWSRSELPTGNRGRR